MHGRMEPALRTSLYWLAGSSLAIGIAGCDWSESSKPTQPEFGTTSLPLLAVDGYKFKDLNKDGTLEPYEDWRLPADERAKDLVNRMTLAEKAGLMMHGTAPVSDDTSGAGTGTAYDLTALDAMVNTQFINTFITRMSGDAQTMAEQYNKIQALAEQSRLGIPVSISTDPRHHFQYTLGTSASSGGFSQWPETLGFAALNDPAQTKRFGEIARQEYRAVGLTQALSPQADLSTEPRWPRVSGTFGEDPAIVKSQVQAYIEGFQGGADGLNPKSVVAVVKHWGGYGAAKDGWDSHTRYGRFMSFPGNNLEMHLKAFEGAFAAKAGSVMPTYSMPDGTYTVNGVTLEAVGAGFSKAMLTDLLRGQYGFKGVILSDWLITADCDEACMNGAAGMPSFVGLGMPWGMETASKLDRFVKAVNAGMDQFGGVTEPEYLIQAVQQGRLTEARLNDSAYRILLQKFQQGLFEQASVDVAKAKTTVGSADFKAEALDVQRKAMVLLQNNASTLPAQLSGKKVWLYGIDASVAASYGFTVVSTPAAADLAIVRVSTPHELLHPNYMFGLFLHEGRLNFADGDADYEAIKAAAAAPKSIVSIYMDRPAILSNVTGKSSAILANFGATDTALFDVITGKAKPQGKLPFELPSSMEEVAAQKSDMPHDSAHPLFALGFGLSY